MKRTLISASILMAFISPYSFAASEHGFNADSIELGEEPSGFGGHIGSSFEYEDKETQSYNGNLIKEKIKTHEIFQVYYNNPQWDYRLLYGLKLYNRDQSEPGYHESEDGLKHFFSIDKGLLSANGWDTGIVYEVEYSATKIDSPYVDNLHHTTIDNSIRPYLTYWNNEYNLGFYSNLEYLYTNEDRSEWGSRTEEGYSILFKPYKRIGNWELGVEFFYQMKDNKDLTVNGIVNENSDFTESYYEPIIQYSFEDAGTLYLRTRFGHNKTVNSGQATGGNANVTYFKSIRKATVGYEQSVGDNWLLKGEYKYANEVENKNKYNSRDVNDENELKQHQIYAHALYRF